MSRTIKQKKTGAKAIAKSCCNNGTCSYCNNNRQYSSLKKLIGTIDQQKNEI